MTPYTKSYPDEVNSHNTRSENKLGVVNGSLCLWFPRVHMGNQQEQICCCPKSSFFTKSSNSPKILNYKLRKLAIKTVKQDKKIPIFSTYSTPTHTTYLHDETQYWTLFLSIRTTQNKSMHFI